MAGDEEALEREFDPIERGIRRRLRVASFVIFMVLLVALVVVDTVGKIVYGTDFHVSDLIVGSLFGTLLLQLGIEITGINGWGPFRK